MTNFEWVIIPYFQESSKSHSEIFKDLDNVKL